MASYDKPVVLVLQGGGALGSYQAGVYQALCEGAVETIRAFETTLLTIMRASSSTPIVRRFDILAPVVDRTFDLQTILRNSVGLKWSGLSAARC